MWAEAKLERCSFVPDAAPDAGLIFRPDAILGPACLHPKGATGAPLAGAAVTHRHSERRSFGNDAKLPAGTGSGACDRFGHLVTRLSCETASQ